MGLTGTQGFNSIIGVDRIIETLTFCRKVVGNFGEFWIASIVLMHWSTGIYGVLPPEADTSGINVSLRPLVGTMDA
jgi:hypothetical protein